MYGYIFETTNTKTGQTYLGKRYAVSFDKNYLGEDCDNALALAIEKYGRPSFSVKMIMPFESQAALDSVFAEKKGAEKIALAKKIESKVKAEPKKEEPVEEVEVEEPKPAKRGRKKKTTEEE